MKTVKKSVFAIGVALSVAPIFSSAYAQSTHNSASVLSDLQAMRTEIAELRDMVERQQFELRKLKQNIAKAQAEKSSLRPQTNTQPTYQQSGQYVGRQSEPQTAPAGIGSLPPNYPEIKQNVDAQAVTGVYQQSESRTVGSSDADIPSLDGGSLSAPTNPNGVDGGGLSKQGVETFERSGEVLGDGQNAAALSVDPSLETIAEMSSASPATVDFLPAEGQNINKALPNTLSGNTQKTLGNVGQTEINPRAGGPILAVPSNPSAQKYNNSASNSTVNADQVPLGSRTSGASVAEVDMAVTTDQTVLDQAVSQTPAVQFTEDQYYDRGFGFLKQSKYDEAISVFNEQITQYPKGELADDAHYWIAEALFINRKSVEAKPHLRTIIENYPQSARLPDAMLKTAYIEQDMGNLIEARILLQEIVAKHSSSNAAIAARNRLENLKSGN